jgi:hypothetical protein
MHALTRKEKLLSVIGVSVFAAIVLLAFKAYTDPAMLIDFANNIRLLCG